MLTRSSFPRASRFALPAAIGALLPALCASWPLAAQPAPVDPSALQPGSAQAAQPGPAQAAPLRPQSSPDLSSQGANATQQRPALVTSNPVNQVLPADSAFVLGVRLHDEASRATLHWDIAPGYYLYRKSIRLGSASADMAPLELPSGTAIEDEFFGAVEVYYERLEIDADTAGLVGKDGSLLLVVEYQGCAEDRYCYPPQRKELLLAQP